MARTASRYRVPEKPDDESDRVIRELRGRVAELEAQVRERDQSIDRLSRQFAQEGARASLFEAAVGQREAAIAGLEARLDESRRAAAAAALSLGNGRVLVK